MTIQAGTIAKIFYVAATAACIGAIGGEHFAYSNAQKKLEKETSGFVGLNLTPAQAELQRAGLICDEALVEAFRETLKQRPQPGSAAMAVVDDTSQLVAYCKNMSR